MMFLMVCLLCHFVRTAQQEELLRTVETWYDAAREDGAAFEALGAAIEALKHSVE